MMMMAGVRRAGSTFTELLALLHVLHALKRFDLQNFVDFGFSGVFFKVLFICLPVTTKLFSMFLVNGYSCVGYRQYVSNSS